MAENTKIEWADHTFNPWTGCQAISPGCKNCYAEAWAKRAGREFGTRLQTSPANWLQPHKWNRLSDQWVRNGGRRARVFCASLADVFDNEAPDEWRFDLFELIRETPHLDWLLLTKRIGNAKAMIERAIADFDIGYAPAFAAWPWPNVWIGATVVNQEEADRDVPKLLATPAAMRFLSIEPMLGPVRLAEHALHGGPGQVDWVIAGGESGAGARPMHPDWVRSLRDQCEAAGVAFLFKQWGEWRARELVEETRGDMPGSLHYERAHDMTYCRIGKKAAGRDLDGREHDEFPLQQRGD